MPLTPGTGVIQDKRETAATPPAADSIKIAPDVAVFATVGAYSSRVILAFTMSNNRTKIGICDMSRRAAAHPYSPNAIGLIVLTRAVIAEGMR